MLLGTYPFLLLLCSKKTINETVRTDWRVFDLVFNRLKQQISVCHPQEYIHSGLPCLWAVNPDDRYKYSLMKGRQHKALKRHTQKKIVKP